MRGLLCAALCWAWPAQAQPMWDLADHWTCNLERHMRTPAGADVVEMDPSGKSYQIDFDAMTVTSAFVDGASKIIQKSHHEADPVTYNILVDAWSFGKFPSVYMEQNGQAWSVGGSGTLNAGDEVWIAMYHCLPTKTGA